MIILLDISLTFLIDQAMFFQNVLLELGIRYTKHRKEMHVMWLIFIHIHSVSRGLADVRDECE
jgi:hypothetical protein